MKVHRFIVENINLAELSNRLVRFDDKQLVHQMKNVLKLKPDENIIIADGRGLEAKGRILKFIKGEAEVHLNEAERNKSEPRKKITLYCALLKRENFELVVQKATEIGVQKIIPIITDKTIKFNINLSRLKKIAREAAEQSGRAVVPDLMQACEFKKALDDAKNNEKNLFFMPESSTWRKVDFGQSNHVGIFIGPEGGWSEIECYLAQANNMEQISLGSLVYKADTAAVIACYITIN